MDIAFTPVKNVLWCLSFGTATQAAHVSPGDEKSSLCNGPVPRPMSMTFVQEGVCCGCLGRFYTESSGKGEEGKKEGNPSFLSRPSNVRENRKTMWFSFSRCSPDVLETKRANLSLAGIPICWHAGSLDGRGAELKEEPQGFLARWNKLIGC